MKKRVLWIAACLVLSLCVSRVLAEGGDCGTGLTWSYDDGGLTLETADGPVMLEKGEIAVVKQHLDF